MKHLRLVYITMLMWAIGYAMVTGFVALHKLYQMNAIGYILDRLTEG